MRKLLFAVFLLATMLAASADTYLPPVLPISVTTTSPTAPPGFRSDYTSTATYGASQSGSFNQFSCVMGGTGASTAGIGTTCLNVSIRPDQTNPWANYQGAEMYALTGGVVIATPTANTSDYVGVTGGITVNASTMANGSTGSHIYPVFATANIGAAGTSPMTHSIHSEQAITSGGLVSYMLGASMLKNGQSPEVGIIVNSTLLQTGYIYTIVTSGTTTWTSVGAANNNVGTSFTATGSAAGTGTAVSTGSAAGTMNVSDGNFQTGTQYIITSVGTSTFNTIGALSNTVGTYFTPTAAGSGGNGTAVVAGASAAYAISAASLSSNQAYRYGLLLADRIPHVGGLLKPPLPVNGDVIAYDNQAPCSPTCPLSIDGVINLPNVTVTGNIISSPNFTLSGAGVISNLNVTPRTPLSSSDTCSTGAIEADATYIYVCTATNTWKRAALTTF